MSLVCRTLVFIKNPEALRLVAAALPQPKYELEFVNDVEEATAHVVSNRMDMFIVDSIYADDERVASLRQYVPTLFVEPDYKQVARKESVLYEESNRMRNAAEKLLRKNYIDWIIDALEYSG